MRCIFLPTPGGRGRAATGAHGPEFFLLAVGLALGLERILARSRRLDGLLHARSPFAAPKCAAQMSVKNSKDFTKVIINLRYCRRCTKSVCIKSISQFGFELENLRRKLGDLKNNVETISPGMQIFL
jgi:hypothetical protein